MSCSVGHRCGCDHAWLWLWLWCRPAATAPIQPLAWEPPYAVGVTLKKTKGKKKAKKQKTQNSMPLLIRVISASYKLGTDRISITLVIELNVYLWQSVSTSSLLYDS